MKPPIPLSFLPPDATYSASRFFLGAGDALHAFSPSLAEDLFQARMDVTAREYASACALNASFYALLSAVFAVILPVRLGMSKLSFELAMIAIATGLAMGIAVIVTMFFYPKIIVTRHSRRLEAELIPATRQLLIEIKSGVPLFNAMASISSDYGDVSVEFQKITRKINSGVHEVNALADSTRENPSMRFRKVLWQISNALKVGSDVAKALETVLAELEKDKVDQIKRYGQELSPWTLAYMMVAVVLPSLGISMLIVISSFLGITIPKITLPLIIMGLAGFQIFFINFVGTRRPAI